MIQEYNDDFADDPFCDFIHVDDLPDLDYVKDMLISVTNALYETGDVENLEDCLENLLACFDLKIPLNHPKLNGRDNNVFSRIN